jgi:hypothetical protein
MRATAIAHQDPPILPDKITNPVLVPQISGIIRSYVALYFSAPMKRLRTLSILVLTLGVIYLAASAFSLYHYRSVLQLFADYGVPDEAQLSVPGVAQARSQLFGAFVAFSLIGVIVIFVGIGLSLAKEWARKFWLGLVSVLFGLHMARLILDYRLSNFLLVERIIEVLLIGGLALLSWYWLRRKSNVEQRVDASAAT